MSANNYMVRSVFWNRRKVGDLGGVTGVNQALKRWVVYWRENGVNNIYIMNESGGQYSKPTFPLIGANNSQTDTALTLPGGEWEVDFFQTEDFLFINARKDDQAKLFICMDDYAELVRIPQVPHLSDQDIAETNFRFTDTQIQSGNVKGFKKDAIKYFQFRFAWRLKNGAHVGHSSPIHFNINRSLNTTYVSKSNQTLTNLYAAQTLSGTNQTPTGEDAGTPTLDEGDIVYLIGQTTTTDNGFYLIGSTWAKTIKVNAPDETFATFSVTPGSDWFYAPSEIEKKIFDGVTLFCSSPKKNLTDAVNDGVYYEVAKWSMNEIIDKKAKELEQTEDQLVTNPVLEADIFSSHRFAGNVASNFQELAVLGGVFTDFAFPEVNRNLKGTDRTGGKFDDIYEEVTIEVGGQTFTRWQLGTYYQDASGELEIPRAFYYPDRRATRIRVWHFISSGSGYELAADIPLKPHPKLNLAYSFIQGVSVTLQNKSHVQDIGSISGTALVTWSNPSDTEVEIPFADTFDIDISIEVTGSTLNSDLIKVYQYDSSGTTEIEIGVLANDIDEAGTFTLSLKNIVMDSGDTFRLKYTNSGGSSGSISGGFLRMTAQSAYLETFSTGSSSNYLTINSDGTNYTSSGSTDTLTNSEGNDKADLNDINLIELQKIKISDLTKFNFPQTYELGDDNFSNECKAILVNSNDISSGQFGQYPLYIFTKNRIFGFEYSDDIDTIFRRVVPVFTEFGVQNRDALVPYKGSVIFISPRGIHVLSGNDVQDIHVPIQEHWNFANLVGEPGSPVTDSKVFFNHKLEEVYFYNQSFTETFAYNFRYKVWFTFDHLTDAQHQLYDEDFPYVLTKTNLFNLEKQSNDKVNVNVRTKPYKITDKRERKKMLRSYLRGTFSKDASDELIVKLQGILGTNSFQDLNDWTTQNNASVYNDLVLRTHYAAMNFYKFIISGNLQPSSKLVSWDLEFDLRPGKQIPANINPEKPETPTSLAAIGGVTNSIDLTWTDNSDNETGFEIWRSATSGSGFSRIKTVGAGTTSYTDDNNGAGLAYSTTYYYKVKAVNLLVQSEFSNEASAATLAPPAAATNLVVTDGFSSIGLAWDDNSSVETGYKIHRSTSAGFTPGPGNLLTTTAANATSYSDSSASAGTTYYYVVVGTNAAGDGDASNEDSGQIFDAFIIYIDTTATGTSTNNQYTVPISSISNNLDAYRVDTGALVKSGITNGDNIIDFGENYTGKVALVGTMQDWSLGDYAGGDTAKFQGVDNWGIFNSTYFGDGQFQGATFDFYTATDTPRFTANGTAKLDYFFGSCTFNVQISNLNDWDVSSITSFSSVFRNSTGFTGDVSNWDVSNGTNFINMFLSCSSFNSDVSGWDVSNATGTGLSSVFKGCTSFNQDLSAWNITSAVTSLNGMLMNCNCNFDASGWDVSNVTGFESCFEGNSNFNNGGVGGSGLGLDTWNTSSATTMKRMFRGTLFNQYIGSWNTGSVQNMDAMFQSTPFNQDIGGWNVSNVTVFGSLNSGMFRGNTAFNQDIGGWNTGSATTFRTMFSGATSFNQDIGDWNVSNVSNAIEMFNGATSFNNGGVGGVGVGMDKWNTSNFSNVFVMFQNSAFNQYIGSWDITGLTSLSRMFDGNNVFDQDLSGWDFVNITNMSGFCDEGSLSTANVDKLYIQIEATNANNGYNIDVGSSTYTSGGAGETARTALNNDHSVTITDGGGV